MDTEQLRELVKKPADVLTAAGNNQELFDLTKSVYNTIFPQENWYDHYALNVPMILRLYNNVLYKRNFTVQPMIQFMSGKWTDGNSHTIRRAFEPIQNNALNLQIIAVTKYIKGIIGNIKATITDIEEETSIAELIKRKLDVDATVFYRGTSFVVVLDMTSNEMSNLPYTSAQYLKEVVAIYTYFKYLLLQEEPVPHEYFVIIDSLIKGNVDAYMAKAKEVLEPLKPLVKKTEQKQGKAILCPLFNKSNAREKTRVKNSIENLESRIKGYLDNISDYTREVRNLQMTLMGLELAEEDGSQDKALELEQFINNNKAIKKFTLGQNNGQTTVTLHISTPVRYYDEALLRKFIIRDAYPRLTPLFDFMLKNPQQKLLCKATLVVNPGDARFFVANQSGNEIVLDEDGFINPHLIGYNCFGGNTHAVSKALVDMDLVTAISQLVVAVSNINYSDGTVINYMQGRITMVGLDNLRFYNLRSKEVKTFKELQVEVKENESSEL